MKIVDETSVFEVVGGNVNLSDPHPFFSLNWAFRNLAAPQADRWDEKYIIYNDLLEGLNLGLKNKTKKLTHLVVKYRRRFRENKDEAGRFILMAKDLPKFEPSEMSITQIDTTIAKRMRVFFTVLQRQPLLLSDLFVSMEADDEIIRQRIPFFEKFGFVSIGDQNPPELRPHIKILDKLASYIESAESGDDFADGTTERISGQREVTSSMHMTISTSAKCGVVMRHGRICGREYHTRGYSSCILHEKDENKHAESFGIELEKLLSDTNGARIDLIGVTFPDSVTSFTDRSFDRPVLFQNCTFLGDIEFKDCQFTKLIFFRCEFRRKSSFITLNAEDISFEYTAFADRFLFSNCRIRQSAMFTSFRSTPLDGRDPPVIDFHWITFLKMPEVEYSDIDMKECKLGRINLHGTRLTNLTWSVSGTGPFWNRYSMSDESKPEQAVEVYRGLQSSYAGNGDFATANQFFASQMEMERRLKPRPSQFLSFNAAYKVFSNYGQSIFLPLIWLFAVVALTSTLIMTIFGNIDGITFSFHGSFGEFFEAYVKNIIMLFDRSQVTAFLGKQWCSRAVNIIESGIGLVLLSFSVIAVRRRFRNRNK
ncbi:MAG: pentapeptide repeat-containing protein [Candidatus Zixiibacteriota bacterium]